MTQSDMASTVAPPRLAPGSKVAVCAPAGPVPEERLRRGLAVLEQRYQVTCELERVLSRSAYLAGEDDARADEVNAYLRDPDIRALFVARGGYGITRILDRLDADALRADPIPIIGFSDATALLLWAGVRAGVRGVHGPVLAQLDELPASDITALYSLLESPAPAPTLAVDVEAGAAARGQLWGGNLCLLSHLAGTGLLPQGPGLLFVEEVGERPYRLDRDLTHLQAAGALSGVQAALLGQLVRCEEEGMPAAAEVVARRFADFGVPFASGLPTGHGTENLALPIFAECELDGDAGVLRFLTGAVS